MATDPMIFVCELNSVNSVRLSLTILEAELFFVSGSLKASNNLNQMCEFADKAGSTPSNRLS